MYTNTFNSFIAFNDSLLPGYLDNTYPYRGPGRCYRNLNTVPSSGVATLICARYPSRYLLTIGRYVTVVPYSHWSWTSVLTICEINVVGVRQNILADGNLWTHAQRASMLYFAHVFLSFFFMRALVGETAERIFTKLSHVVDIRHHL